MIRQIPLALALALSLAACGAEADSDPASESPDPTEAPTAVAEEPADEEAMEIAEEDFPIPEDFEEEAATSITAENLEDEVAALEAELAE